MQLETGRLLLRSLDPADAATLAQLWIDPFVTGFMGGPRNFEQVWATLREDAQTVPPPRFDLWPVIEKASDQIIGHCGLLDKSIADQPEVELVYVLAHSAWGKGYATEIGTALKAYAFEQLGLTRLVALIDPHNTASERVALKVGLHYERDTLRPGGKTMRLYVAESHFDQREKSQ